MNLVDLRCPECGVVAVSVRPGLHVATWVARCARCGWGGPPRATQTEAIRDYQPAKPEDRPLKIVYIGHRVSGDVEANVRSALAWYKRLTIAYLNEVAFVADWLLWCQVLDDADPQMRAAGLRFDEQLVPRCDEFWGVGPGPGFSSGMVGEARAGVAAKLVVRDLTDEDVGKDGRFTEVQLSDGAARWEAFLATQSGIV